jgi:hypothetical protein
MSVYSRRRKELPPPPPPIRQKNHKLMKNWSVVTGQSPQLHGVACQPLWYLGEVKMKFTIKQATKAQRGSTGVAVLFNLGGR